MISIDEFETLGCDVDHPIPKAILVGYLGIEDLIRVLSLYGLVCPGESFVRSIAL